MYLEKLRKSCDFIFLNKPLKLELLKVELKLKDFISMYNARDVPVKFYHLHH